MRRRLVLLGSAGIVLASGVALGVPALPDPAPMSGSPAPVEAAPEPMTRAPAGGDLDVMLRQYDAEEKSIRMELDQIDKEHADVEARVVSRGRVYFKKVRAGLLPAGGGFDELVDYAANVERTRLALARDLERETTLDKRKRTLEDKLARLKANRAPLEVHREAMAQARSALREAEDRKSAFDMAFKSSTTPGDVAIYGADGPLNDAKDQGFQSLFGHLPYPIAGRAVIHPVEKSVSHPPHIDLVAPPGAVARSVASARVAFADTVDDDRVEIVLDHGDRFFTVYKNLLRTDVKVGESIAANTALGPVGNKGKDGPTLYFELRQNGQAVEPGPWLGGL